MKSTRARLGWFVLIWCLSVLLLATVSGVIRWALIG